MKPIKPLIKYFGGKSLMMNTLISYFPDKSSYSVFIDAFGGSGSVLLSQEPNGIEIYNDLEENVYSLHKVLATRTLFAEFKEKCDIAIYSEQLRKEYKLELKNTGINIVDRAFMFFYINRTSINGVGGFSVTKLIRRGMSKSTSDFLSSIDRLPEIHSRLSSVVILNRDALKLISENDVSSVFIYADSPYVFSTRGNTRYVIDMDDIKQREYIDVLLSMKHAKIAVSGYNCQLYDTLCSNGWHRVDFSVENGKRIESLWMNYAENSKCRN